MVTIATPQISPYDKFADNKEKKINEKKAKFINEEIKLIH